MMTEKKKEVKSTEETQITVIKPTNHGDTLTKSTLKELFQLIQNNDYGQILSDLRTTFPTLGYHREADGLAKGEFTFAKKLPHICVSSLSEKHDGDILMKEYTGLILLELNHLSHYDDAIQFRNLASQLPQTIMTFVGASGRSVKIICCGAWTRDKEHPSDTLPQTKEEIKKFHQQLFAKARGLYQAHLETTLENYTDIDRCCYLSQDPGAFYEPDAVPIYISKVERRNEATPIRHDAEDEMGKYKELYPGQNLAGTQRRSYQDCLNKAEEQCLDTNDDDWAHQVLILLGHYCVECGVPQAKAIRWASLNENLNEDPELVKVTISSAYSRHLMKEYKERKRIFEPLKNMPPSSLLLIKTNIFMETHFDIRLNVLTNTPQYREKTWADQNYQPVTEDVRNMMTERAQLNGVNIWDKDIDRYLHSSERTRYNPLTDYLRSLPTWDGRDRVKELALRIPTNREKWSWYFHIFMRGMVAQWMGLNKKTGNSIVLLFCGEQGSGKTFMARKILPPELDDYYLERLDFKKPADLNIALSSYGLINLDEFDSIPKSQMAILKSYVSTGEIKYREVYGKMFVKRSKYASFVGTTNQLQPLVDDTGSRRFVCAQITGAIDFQSPIEYDQLYAQLKYELEHGEKYYIEGNETSSLTAENNQFTKSDMLDYIINDSLVNPTGNDICEGYTAADIIEEFKRRYKRQFDEKRFTPVVVGRRLSNAVHHFKWQHKVNGRVYFVKWK